MSGNNNDTTIASDMHFFSKHFYIMAVFRRLNAEKDPPF